jgi:hypothetical protein
MSIVVQSLSCPRAEGIPLGKAGIHFDNKDALVDSRIRLPRRQAGGNDKLAVRPNLKFGACTFKMDFL